MAVGSRVLRAERRKGIKPGACSERNFRRLNTVVRFSKLVCYIVPCSLFKVSHYNLATRHHTF